MIRCFQLQDYQGEVEWIIVDDGSDPIEDLVFSIPQVKYIRLETKHALGEKRNLMHSYASGDILIYMDDDDYYPPNRISHAVEKLTQSDALCAGSSIIHVYFDHIKKVVEFGPYGPNHATAGTFAIKKELLTHTSYDASANYAEEKFFLKNFTIPMIQLDPDKTILVVSHANNTFDKKKLLSHFNAFMKVTTLTVEDFIHDPVLLQFFTKDIHSLIQIQKPVNSTNLLLKVMQQR
jgi:glycosyltransferase involved in cell wall biosynthesis